MPAASIAFAIQQYPPAHGGAELQAQHLARELARRLGHCDVVTTRTERDEPRKERDGRVGVRRLRAVRSGFLRRPSQFLAALLHFVIHGRSYRVVHLHCLSPFTLGALVGARLYGRGTVVKVSTVGSDGEIWKVRRVPGGGLLWKLFLGADRFVAQTPSLVRELAEDGVDRRRIVEIPNAVRLERGADDPAAARQAARRRLALPARVTVLAMGRLAPEKGLGLLLDAWRQVAGRRDATLLVAGDGPERDWIEGWVAGAGLGARVRLLGWQADPSPLLEAADVFVQASWSESFGNGLAEAMLYGLAVVATPVGLARDWIRDGQSGIVLRGREPAELAAVLERLLDDEPLRLALGRSAREQALRLFSSQRVTEEYIALYDALAPAAARI